MFKRKIARTALLAAATLIGKRLLRRKRKGKGRGKCKKGRGRGRGRAVTL